MQRIEDALRPNTTVLYLESPNTMTFECQDLTACAVLAKSRDIVTIIDNSYCSPLYQNPAAFGIDVVNTAVPSTSMAILMWWLVCFVPARRW